MSIGTQRTATAILEAKGAFKKNPNRKRESEPVVNDPLDKAPPKSLSEFEAECWSEIIDIAPAGVLTAADKISVELIAVLLAEFRLNKADTTAAIINRLAQELTKLGLNPSGRAGLTVDKPKENQFKK